MWEMERRYSVPSNDTGLVDSSSATARSAPHSHQKTPSLSPTILGPLPPSTAASASASEDLHAWSIYRQNLNSDFTDSALGSSEKSPLPYGNFQLRESTVQSILSHPRYGPKSPLGSNMYTYLKFGLPRVLPPNAVAGGPRAGSRAPRDGSSGYNSSDEGGGPGGRSGRHHSHYGPSHQSQSYYLRTRSDPDFRNTPYHGPVMRRGPMVGPVEYKGVRQKSMSEANLLSAEAVMRHQHHNIGMVGMERRPQHRRSVHDLRAVSEMEHHIHPQHADFLHRRPASVAVPNIGPHRSSSASILSGGGYVPQFEPDIMSFQVTRPNMYSGQYPHLQVRGLDVLLNKNEALLQGISFEVRAGELLSVMATSAEEGTAFLDSLAGRCKCRANHILLNGQSVSIEVLKQRITYVRSKTFLSPDFNVAQTLTFYSKLRRSPRVTGIKYSLTEKMELLIEELGLTQVLNTKVSSLTSSEIQRLNLACHLLSDSEILLLDQPTQVMDIFDTFFLVEFLRQWASGGSTGMMGRIIILTLHPPTYEIFTMVSRVLLISSGRMMYSGRRRDLLPYFATADYPCPAFKNPSDYYLDLVTLDDLSAEAMLESSQRIEQLSELFKRRQEPLTDPGPLQALPGKTRRAGIFSQASAIVFRQMVYSQPSSLLDWLSYLLLAIVLSLIIGAVFWNLPQTDPQLTLNDRLGFHHTIFCVGSLPLLLLLAVARSHGHDRAAVESDVEAGLYSRFIYIFVALLCGLPTSLVIWLAYIIPAYAMTGDMQGNEIYFYILYMLLHLSGTQAFVTMLGYALPNCISVAILSSILLIVLSLVNGFSIHLNDLHGDLQQSPWFNYFDYVGLLSTSRWIMPVFLQQELSTETLVLNAANLVCRNKQVQHQDIIVQLPCPAPNGTAALQFYGYLSAKDYNPFHITSWQPYYAPTGFYIVSIVISIFLYVLVGKHCYKYKSIRR
nr:PREDICTED: ATP-binding cassette sub-family G member 8 [Bemisia tabaci]XP_018915500.1 PREDICTED: ATP-binding cassette sub-family G member 8 [Bemisia tabaci]